jgi:hypothetical protein
LTLSEYSFKSEKSNDVGDKKKLSYVKYDPLPAWNNCKYIPEPFRHKYEICYWRIGDYGVTKAKSYYFTPKVSFINLNMLIGAKRPRFLLSQSTFIYR